MLDSAYIWDFHDENEFVRGKQHVNGIERFWGFAEHRLVKFNSSVYHAKRMNV